MLEMDVVEYEFEKYRCTKETLKDTLDKYGVAIIPSLLDKEECNSLREGTWQFFEHITQQWDEPINRYVPESWSKLATLNPLTKNHVYGNWHIGHTQSVWDLRQNPKVLDIFATFWEENVEDLLVSFDGQGFLPPPEETGVGWFKESNYWFHLDQTLKRSSFYGIQSWITANDVEEGDGTLHFFEGSHLLIERFVEHYGYVSVTDWVTVGDYVSEFYRPICGTPKAIKCPAGSLVIWDSRTAHCGMGAFRGRKNANFRNVYYLNYMPRGAIEDTDEEDVLERRIIGFEGMLTSNHYPNRATFFSTIPLAYINAGCSKVAEDYVDLIEPPKLTKIGRRLVGYDE